MFRLVISDDEGKTSVVPLVGDEVTIGRDAANIICLAERNVSRAHAKLERLNGSYAVADLGSYNGVRVNGIRIDGKSKLKAGDQIAIGDFVLAFHSVAPADGVTDPKAAALDLTDPLAPSHVTATQDTAIIPKPDEAQPARLVMLAGPDPGHEYPLQRNSMRIGRMDEAQVRVNHKSISREHAAVSPSGESFRIRDLKSANGVRVNGKEVKDVELRSGDVIELGQVRFRYVGPGEPYVYDPAESTGQTMAVGYGDGGSKGPIYALMAVACFGLLAVVAYFVKSTPEAQPVEVAQATAPPVAAPAMSEAEARGLVAACELAVKESRYREGAELADRVIRMVPAHEAARGCQALAAQGLADVERFGRGALLLQSGDGVGAYAEFTQLSAGSAFLDRPEVLDAAGKFADHHVAEAKANVKKDRALAQQHAEQVLGMREVLPAQQRAAQQVLERLGLREPAPDSAGNPDADPPRETRPSRPRPTPNERPADRDAPDKDSGSGPRASVTQQCAAEGGDVNQCVVKRLAGSARSAGDLAELILAYQAQHDTENMLKAMRKFTESYPSHPKSRAYTQVLLRHQATP